MNGRTDEFSACRLCDICYNIIFRIFYKLLQRNTAVASSSSSWGQGVTTIGFGAAPQASAFPSSTSSSIRTAITISSNLPHDVTPSTLPPPALATSSLAFPTQTPSSGIQVFKSFDGLVCDSSLRCGSSICST